MSRAVSITFRAGQAVLKKLAGHTSRGLMRGRGRVPILMYHRVIPDRGNVDRVEPGMYVRESTFEKHVRWLRRRYDLVTLAHAIDAAKELRTNGLAVLTFDDGWKDNLTVAWPILRRHSARATIFLVADWVAQGRTDRGEFLSPANVRALATEGMEMGAHTVSHPKLDEACPDTIERELRTSKEIVSSWTGCPCRTFAYPFGRFSDAAVVAASRHFDAAVVVGGGWWSTDGHMARIPRIAIHDDVTRWIPMFEARLAGAA